MLFVRWRQYIVDPNPHLITYLRFNHTFMYVERYVIRYVMNSTELYRPKQTLILGVRSIGTL